MFLKYAKLVNLNIVLICHMGTTFTKKNTTLDVIDGILIGSSLFN